MTPDKTTTIFDAFDAAASAVATTRVPVRRGRASAEDVRRHTARTAARFYLATVWKRAARAALPGDEPEDPVKVRPISRAPSPPGQRKNDGRE